MKKSYTSTLVDIRGGMLVEEATEQLNQLVALVRDTGKTRSTAMPRQKLTDEERAQRREARLEKAREKRAEAAAKREREKSAIRSEIEGLASVIPPPYSERSSQYRSSMERRAR